MAWDRGGLQKKKEMDIYATPTRVVSTRPTILLLNLPDINFCQRHLSFSAVALDTVPDPKHSFLLPDLFVAKKWRRRRRGDEKNGFISSVSFAKPYRGFFLFRGRKEKKIHLKMLSAPDYENSPRLFSIKNDSWMWCYILL